MKTYIGIHNFIPKKNYPDINEIKKKIDSAISILSQKNSIEKSKRDNMYTKVLECMKLYNKLLGIDDTGLQNPSLNPPKGILPKYTSEILKYFSNLDEKVSNKEIKILELSGIKEIKIRYKHSDSVIKKLVKIADEDLDYLSVPLNVFIRGGRLHDLIGIDFICHYPFQREWVARSLFNFFKIPDRTDYNLIYGFYKLDRDSGYKALHCDKSYFKPSFDQEFIKNHYNNRINITYANNDGIEYVLNYIDNKNYENILEKLAKVFNIEIQIHTYFESAWSKMEHEKSYDLLSKGKGRNKEIEVLWKILSDNLSIMENQFENLQTLTEYSITDNIGEKKDLNFIYTLLTNVKHKSTITESSTLIKKLFKKLYKHEISRREYVYKLNKHIEELKAIINKSGLTNLEEGIFKLQIAFIYYNYSNLDKYFNEKDMSQLLSKGIEIYKEILEENRDQDISRNEYILISLNSIIRYNRLRQKNGFGLISSNETENFYNHLEQKTTTDNAIKYFQLGLHYMLLLTKGNNTSYESLKKDTKTYLRTILYLYKMIMEVELTIKDYKLISELELIYDDLNDLVSKFIKEYINYDVKKIFLGMIKEVKTSDKSFIIATANMLIRNKLFKPIDGLKIILKIASNNKIRTKDLFFYEEASYKYLYDYYIDKKFDEEKLSDGNLIYQSFKHYGDYHYENMIYLLYKMKKENIYEYYKAQIYFNKLVDNDKLYKILSKQSKEKKHFDEAYFSTKYVS